MKNETQKSRLKKWLNIIISWIDNFGIAKEQPLTTVPRQVFYGRGWMLVEIERDTIGAVQTWRLCIHNYPWWIVFSLDNLADFQRHCLRMERQKDPCNCSREIVDVGEHTHRIAITRCKVTTQKSTQKVLVVIDLNLIDPWSRGHAEDFRAENLLRDLCKRTGAQMEGNELPTEELLSFDWWEDRIIKLSNFYFDSQHNLNITQRELL
ncbi:MAG: hypothetical protein WA919_07185 [Coleofasciculaceae cyanobacterium]